MAVLDFMARLKATKSARDTGKPGGWEAWLRPTTGLVMRRKGSLGLWEYREPTRDEQWKYTQDDAW
jgi:hypothetical protein